MYFIVNTKLKMGKGKIAAQVGHATQYLYADLSTKERVEYMSQTPPNKKIVLKNHREKMNLEYLPGDVEGVRVVTVRDAGLTQIPAYSVTVVGLFGEEDYLKELLKDYKLL